MKRTMVKKAFSAFISIALVAAFAFPTTALAAQPEVQVENHTEAGAQTISGISIDGVDAPSVGKSLDDKATVSTAEGASWDIPVLWIGDDLQLATEAVEGRTYLPALAFFVPQEYTVEGGGFTVTLSDSLTKLFGDTDAISVFDARTGITYILPVSLKDFFAHAEDAANGSTAQEALESADDIIGEGLGDGENVPARTAVDLYCAQTARDVLSDDDLNYLVNLVLNTLEPQAVNLLINSFPSFKAAAAQNQIGTNIGLYIYYKSGDKDGKPEHESAPNTLAYVIGDAVKKDGEIKYCYMIGIDVETLLLKNNDVLVKDESTGKYKLDRNGEGMVTFTNTIVHELFHAIEDDYNRTGTLGAKNIADRYTPNGVFASEAQAQLYHALRYPSWFIEGTASAVENVYQFRNGSFVMLRAVRDSETTIENKYTPNTLIYDYMNATYKGKPLYYGLTYASNSQVDYTQSRYTSGYLAVLYLSQLAAQKDPTIGTAVDKQNNFSSEKLRLGLDSILKRMHNGETLDQVIRDISSFNGAAPLYNDTDDFEKKFIVGVPDSEQVYHGDNSLYFTVDFLNYMLSLENTQGRKNKPNGSILFDFSKDFDAPLDLTKEASSDYLIIIGSNEMVESTVPNSIALAGGGKSDPPKTATSANQAVAAKFSNELPLAAKEGVESSTEEKLVETESNSVSGVTSEAESGSANEEEATNTANESVKEEACEPASAQEACEPAADNTESISVATVADNTAEPVTLAETQQATTVDEASTLLS